MLGWMYRMRSIGNLKYIIGLTIAMLVIGAITLSPPTHQRVAGLFGTQLTSHTPQDFMSSGTPIDAATLNGHPGLHYLQAHDLVGTISPALYSAYQDLVAGGQILAGTSLLTSGS